MKVTKQIKVQTRAANNKPKSRHYKTSSAGKIEPEISSIFIKNILERNTYNNRVIEPTQVNNYLNNDVTMPEFAETVHNLFCDENYKRKAMDYLSKYRTGVRSPGKKSGEINTNLSKKKAVNAPSFKGDFKGDFIYHKATRTETNFYEPRKKEKKFRTVEKSIENEGSNYDYSRYILDNNGSNIYNNNNNNNNNNSNISNNNIDINNRSGPKYIGVNRTKANTRIFPYNITNNTTTYNNNYFGPNPSNAYSPINPHQFIYTNSQDNNIYSNERNITDPLYFDHNNITTANNYVYQNPQTTKNRLSNYNPIFEEHTFSQMKSIDYSSNYGTNNTKINSLSHPKKSPQLPKKESSDNLINYFKYEDQPLISSTNKSIFLQRPKRDKNEYLYMSLDCGDDDSDLEKDIKNNNREVITASFNRFGVPSGRSRGKRAGNFTEYKPLEINTFSSKNPISTVNSNVESKALSPSFAATFNNNVFSGKTRKEERSKNAVKRGSNYSGKENVRISNFSNNCSNLNSNLNTNRIEPENKTCSKEFASELKSERATDITISQQINRNSSQNYMGKAVQNRSFKDKEQGKNKLIFNSDEEIIEYINKKYNEKKGEKTGKFCGFVLQKSYENKPYFDVKMSGSLEEINEKLMENEVKIDGKLVALTYVNNYKNKIDGDKISFSLFNMDKKSNMHLITDKNNSLNNNKGRFSKIKDTHNRSINYSKSCKNPYEITKENDIELIGIEDLIENIITPAKYRREKYSINVYKPNKKRDNSLKKESIKTEYGQYRQPIDLKENLDILDLREEPVTVEKEAGNEGHEDGSLNVGEESGCVKGRGNSDKEVMKSRGGVGGDVVEVSRNMENNNKENDTLFVNKENNNNNVVNKIKVKDTSTADLLNKEKYMDDETKPTNNTASKYENSGQNFIRKEESESSESEVYVDKKDYMDDNINNKDTEYLDEIKDDSTETNVILSQLVNNEINDVLSKVYDAMNVMSEKESEFKEGKVGVKGGEKDERRRNVNNVGVGVNAHENETVEIRTNNENDGSNKGDELLNNGGDDKINEIKVCEIHDKITDGVNNNNVKAGNIDSLEPAEVNKENPEMKTTSEDNIHDSDTRTECKNNGETEAKAIELNKKRVELVENPQSKESRAMKRLLKAKEMAKTNKREEKTVNKSAKIEEMADELEKTLKKGGKFKLHLDLSRIKKEHEKDDINKIVKAVGVEKEENEQEEFELDEDVISNFMMKQRRDKNDDSL